MSQSIKMRDSTLEGKEQEQINLVVHLIYGSGNDWFRISTRHSSQNQNKFRTYVLENFVPCRTTFSTASRKSRSVATFRRARMANIPASVATDRSSAPVELGHSRAIKSKRISRSTLILKRENSALDDHRSKQRLRMDEPSCVDPENVCPSLVVW